MRNVLALLLIASACASVRDAPFVDDGGRGKLPILFVHGNGSDSSVWRAQLDAFRATGRRAAAIDLPGFGRSAPPPNGDFSLVAMVAAIERAAAAHHLRRFVIVGHSYGGAVVAAYAAAHPERVAGVVYVDSAAAKITLAREQREKIAAAIRADKMKFVHAWFAPILKPSSERVQDEVFASVERAPTAVFIAALESLADFDAKALVGAYRGPRLAIVAADLENAGSFQKQFPEIETVRITNAGHWVMLDKPAEVNAAIADFVSLVSKRLDRIEPRGFVRRVDSEKESDRD